LYWGRVVSRLRFLGFATNKGGGEDGGVDAGSAGSDENSRSDAALSEPGWIGLK
jgi:hypothetical protein